MSPAARCAAPRSGPTPARRGHPVPNPVASNIVNMKLLYGVDNGAGGTDWVPATGQWSAANVLAAGISQVGKIRAVRIGFVVQRRAVGQGDSATTTC